MLTAGLSIGRRPEPAAGIVGRSGGPQDGGHGAANADREALLVPVGTRLVHIGPSEDRDHVVAGARCGRAVTRCVAQGVRYAGRARPLGRRRTGGAGSIRSASRRRGAPPPIRLWKDLVGDIRRAREPRLILSSEFLADAQPDGIRRLVETSIPPGCASRSRSGRSPAMLASQWQQNVQAGRTTSSTPWLQELFNRPDGARDSHVAPPPPRPRDHPMGRDRRPRPDDGRRRGRPGPRPGPARLRGPAGADARTLALQDDLANRSLTLAEVEALRAFNVAFKSRQLGRGLQMRVLRLGLAGPMKVRRPAPDEPRIETPQWALDRAGELSREMVANIEASGVQVVGDLSRLVEVPVSGLTGDRLPDPAIPPSIAASMAMGILLARSDEDEPIELARVPTRRLATVLCRRVRGAVRSHSRIAWRRLRSSHRRA